MNIIQIQDRLKGMPKEAIIQYVQNPTGDVPTFLALGELQRRKDAEEKYAATKEQPATVAEQLVAENAPMGIGNMVAQNQPMPDTGIAAPQPNSMNAVGSGIAQLPVPEQTFANGGIVAFAEDDLVEVDDINPYLPFAPSAGEQQPIAVPESYTPEEFLQEKRTYAEQFGIDPEFYKKQAEELKAEREELKAEKSEAANMALLKAGLGIAGGTSQFALENLKEGALPAIEAYGADIKDIKQQDRLLKDADRKLRQAQQAEARGDMQTARQLMQQREAVQLKVMELNLSTLAALAKAKGLNSEQFKTANEIMKTTFGDDALKTQFQGDINQYNKAFNQILNNIAAGELTTGSDIIGSKYTTIGGGPAPGATIPAPTGTPKISSGEEGIALYNSLPPGSMYIDPNGNLKQKK